MRAGLRMLPPCFLSAPLVLVLHITRFITAEPAWDSFRTEASTDVNTA